MTTTFAARYRAIASRDPRHDGRFFTAVTSTGIYCRPSCPARTPRPENVRFFPTAQAARSAGFRPCLRCEPDRWTPSDAGGTSEDLARRALALIMGGIVDEEGVGGLSARLHVSDRHLHRLVTASFGSPPLAIARARRAEAAWDLLTLTDMRASDVAFAAGYASVRQFNDHIRETFGSSPTELRRRGGGGGGVRSLVLRLRHRRPYAGEPVLAFLEARAIAGLEEREHGAYRRSLRLGRSHAVLEGTLNPEEGHVTVRLELGDLRDLPRAVSAARRVFDLDADPEAVATALSADPALRPLVRRRPGMRIPGHPDGLELAVRAIVGQQVTVAGARTLVGRLVSELGEALPSPTGGVTHLFPSAEALLGADLSSIGLTTGRIRAIQALAEAVTSGRLKLDAGTPPRDVQRSLLELPGIGPWTAGYVAMRLLDPDAIPVDDLGLRRAYASLRGSGEPLMARAEAWRPWRAYAAMHLWTHLAQRNSAL
ncbi:MAG TPA: AlkA N-terminal domain-containing protein [Actinomycetota bacterium]